LGLSVNVSARQFRQRDFLNKHGCAAYQGFLFGEPMPIDEFGRIL